MYAALPLFATLALALSAPAHAAPTTAADQKVVLELLQKKAQQIERYVYEDTLTLLKRHCGTAKDTPTQQCEAAVTYGLEVLGSLRSGTPSVSEALRTAAGGVITVCTPGTPVPATDVDLLVAAEKAVAACGLIAAAEAEAGDKNRVHRAELPTALAEAAARSISTDGNDTKFDKVGLASHLSANWQRRQGVGLYLSMGTGFTQTADGGLICDKDTGGSCEFTGMNITSEKLGAVYRWQPFGASPQRIKSLRRSDLHAGAAVSGLLYGTVLEKEQLMTAQAGPFAGLSLAGVLDINAGYVWRLDRDDRAPGTWTLQADLPLHEYISAITGR